MFLTKRKKKEKIIESFQLLGWLLENGLTMLDSIQVMQRFFRMLYIYRFKYPTAFQQFEKYWFLNDLWFDIKAGIIQGFTLSDCVKGRYHKLIDSNIVERIVQGEDNGNLPTMLIQIDRDETDEGESSILESEDYGIVRIVNTIIQHAYYLKAKKVALKLLSDGETPFESEPVDNKRPLKEDYLVNRGTPFEFYTGEIIEEEVAKIYCESESEDRCRVYIQIEGKWHLYYMLPDVLQVRIINRLLLMSALPYWTKSESEAFIKYHRYGADTIHIKVNYFPESQSIILTF